MAGNTPSVLIFLVAGAIASPVHDVNVNPTHYGDPASGCPQDAYTPRPRQGGNQEPLRLSFDKHWLRGTRPKVVWRSVQQTNLLGLEMLQLAALVKLAATRVFAS